MSERPTLPPPQIGTVIADGEEKGTKRTEYARAGVPYYIIYDPFKNLGGDVLEVYALLARNYERRPDTWLPGIGLGVTLWEGIFEGQRATWLRWCDQEGIVISTGAERTASERQRADSERQRAERLAQKLRELGMDPDQL